MKLRFLSTPTAVATVVLALALPALGASAAEITLNAVTYPESRSIDVTFAPTNRATKDAKLYGDVSYENAQAKISLKLRKFEPAVLFGGDVTSYVVWAVSADGSVENLGELPVRDSSGSVTYQTGKKAFALMVTAEPYPGMSSPSPLVVYTSAAADSKYAKNQAFAFSGYTKLAIKSDLESIQNLSWTGSENFNLVQARKTIELATRFGAEKYAGPLLAESRQLLAQAENSTKSGGSSRAVVDYAQRSLAKTTEAITTTEKAKAAEAAAAEAAKRAADKAALEAKALSAQEANQRTTALLQKTEVAKADLEQAKANLEAQNARLQSDQKALAAEKAKLQAERDALAARLGGALSKVADTKNTARGQVLNLPDILFDVNKATLKPELQVIIGKLAGILLMVPELNVRVEGFTDSSGSLQTNMKLSEARAKAVSDLLATQGVDATRLTFGGYGPQNPVAPNETKEGRAKNRRVEIIVKEGTIEATKVEAPASPASPAAPAAPTAPKK